MYCDLGLNTQQIATDLFCVEYLSVGYPDQHSKSLRESELGKYEKSKMAANMAANLGKVATSLVLEGIGQYFWFLHVGFGG